MKRKILDLIDQYQKIIIHRHSNPDLDALGSQCGLAEVIRATYPEKQVYVVGSEEKRLSFLYRMDSVSDHVYKDALVIICDTDYRENICDKRYSKGDLIIKIDHHPENDSYGHILWTEITASSTSEMVYELYEFGKDRGYRLNRKAAYLLYAGIVGDTGRFMFNNTTERTFNIAGELLSYNFSTTELFTQLQKMDLSVARLKGYILQYFHITLSGVGYIKLDYDTIKKLKVTTSDAFQLINVFSNVENIRVWVFFIEEPNQINVRLRSNEIMINQLAEKYGGGGHKYSAGMAIYNWNQVNDVISELENLCCGIEKIVI